MLFLRKDSPSGVGFGWVEEFADCLPAKYSGEILEEIREVLARTDQAHLLADPVFLPDTFGFTHQQ